MNTVEPPQSASGQRSEFLGTWLDPKARALVTIEANARFGGNVSGYLRFLVEQDLSKQEERAAVLSKLSPAERELLGVARLTKGAAA